MLNAFLRPTAPPACARFLGSAALACAGLLWAPTPHAATAELTEQAGSGAFKHYQGWREAPLQDWREANERVGEIGGWRTYLRELQPEGGDADQGHHGHHGH